jgi:predicted dinucleotide-utilizing enzyme
MVAALGSTRYTDNQADIRENVEEMVAENVEPKDELMELVVYLQDKNEVLYNDCGVTYPKTIQVAMTIGVADASLTYLFANELSRYGDYASVAINNGVAQIVITNDDDPSGHKLSGLSSCESRHLFQVLEDTLTQYESIESIELFSPSEKIEF